MLAYILEQTTAPDTASVVHPTIISARPACATDESYNGMAFVLSGKRYGAGASVRTVEDGRVCYLMGIDIVRTSPRRSHKGVAVRVVVLVSIYCRPGPVHVSPPG